MCFEFVVVLVMVFVVVGVCDDEGDRFLVMVGKSGGNNGVDCWVNSEFVCICVD